MSSRAQRVYDSLNTDTTLLYDLLTIVHQHRRRVAGPWTQVSETRRKRVGPNGKSVAIVRYLHDGNWRWLVELVSSTQHTNGQPHGTFTSQIKQGDAPTESEAKRMADDELTQYAWRLEG